MTSGRLHGKCTLVTGGARGIGRAIVERFLEEGASVLLTDIDEGAGADALAPNLAELQLLNGDDLPLAL